MKTKEEDMSKAIIVSGPVIVERGEVLLDKSGNDDFWKFCGGKVKDSDQDLIANAIRKAKEEMGIELIILELTPFVMHIQKDGKNITLVHYLAQRIGEIEPGPDTKEWRWIDITDLEHFGFIE